MAADDTRTPSVGLFRVIDLMQQAAVVLTQVGMDFRVGHLNSSACRALGAGPVDLVNRQLSDVLPVDTAQALHRLCADALRSKPPVERWAAAPDPLTDLTGTASIAVRATGVDGVVLCTWMPGPDAVDTGCRSVTAGGPSVDERMQLAATVDALAGLGLGVFSFDLMAGRLVWSTGMYEIFHRPRSAGPVGPSELLDLLEPASVPAARWRALLRVGAPVDAEVRLIPRIGGKRLQLTAHAIRGADGHPTFVYGRCRLLRP